MVHSIPGIPLKVYQGIHYTFTCAIVRIKDVYMNNRDDCFLKIFKSQIQLLIY